MLRATILTTIFATIVLLGTVAISSVFGAELYGVKMPDQVTVAGKALKLNGLGARKATFLKVKVYVAGLYLETLEKDGEKILQSKQLKQVDMHFVHDVDKKKLVEAWNEGREKNCKENCETLAPAYEKLESYMTDIKVGDLMVFTFYPDKVGVEVKGDKKPDIVGDLFSRTLLSTWIGPNPPNTDLKEGMLGR